MDKNIDIMPDQVEAPKLNPTEVALEALEQEFEDRVDEELEEEEAERYFERMNRGLHKDLDTLSQDENEEKATRAEFAKLTLENVEESWDELYEYIEREDSSGLEKGLKKLKSNFAKSLEDSDIPESKREAVLAEMNEYLDCMIEVAQKVQYDASTGLKLAVFAAECTPILGDAISCTNAVRGKTLDGVHLSPGARTLEFAFGAGSLGLAAFTAGGGSLASTGSKLAAGGVKVAGKFGDDAARLTGKGFKYAGKAFDKGKELKEAKETFWDMPRDNIKGAKMVVEGVTKKIRKGFVEGDEVTIEAFRELKRQRDDVFSAMVNA